MIKPKYGQCQGLTQPVVGPVIRFSVDDKGSGETVVANEGKVTVKVKVEAPMDGLNFVKVFANGIQAKNLCLQKFEVVRLVKLSSLN